MERPVVVGVDGSGNSVRALDWGVEEARLRGLPLRIVYASLWERYGEGAAEEKEAEERVLSAAAERAARWVGEPLVTTRAVSDEPAVALVEESRTAALLAVGHRGRGELASLLLGTVSLTVAGRAHCPVIVVRGQGWPPSSPGRGGRIVVGVGEGTGSEATVAFAYGEAALRRGEIEAVHAWRCAGSDLAEESGPYSKRREEHLHRASDMLEAALAPAACEHPEIPVTPRPAEGNPRDILLAASAGADLLVVGAQRHRHTLGLQLGPVNHAVLHHAGCPVAVVPRA
ncbi:universal stress protein [Streptomyces paromomycinus]|uniref:Universal stress protein n=1 Tax=Streptomyces paromomycinus TaxID=92743 RepID=A0A401WFU3_STREY|nr:universal stress protein [Streptomyces paromomycinus]GCD48181.1 universal stress protein [Streptomyces paromomycinus]